MPVYNAGAYLKDAIQSIIDQTFSDYTFLIINDGSTDGSEEIIKGFMDNRICYRKHEINNGLISTLNEGLDLATGTYVVRMDADDVSLPERIEKQVAFMDVNPEIAISGTWLSVINSSDVIAHPATADECEVMLLYNTVLGHPSTILRREDIIKNNLRFDNGALYAEDYKFWAEASIKGLKLVNIPDTLVNYRVHSEQVSSLKAEQQAQTVMQIKRWYGQHFFNDIISNRLSVYTAFINGSINSFADFLIATDLAGQIKSKNRLNSYFNIPVFDRFINNQVKISAKRIFVLCVDCNLKNLIKSITNKYFYTSTSLFQKGKFIFRSVQKTFS